MENNEFWKEKLAGYDEHEWSKHPSIFAQDVARLFPPRGSVLELAGGQGQDSRWFASQGFNVTYSDLVEDVVQKVRKQVATDPNITCLAVDLSKELPFKAASFDVVYSHMGLHYFDRMETRRIFANIHHTLKPDGIVALILNTIDDPEIQTYGYRQIEPHFFEDPRSGLKKSYFSSGYVQELTRDLFEQLLNDHNGKTYKDSVQTLVRFVGKKR
ncbi:MAG: class I SAM-dependent methyltransferase [Candidatus Peribacteraceae bacterium]|nr:class I SAM-dependent methyltransferase [Candidatus Peribacteraceae bacterium]